MNAIDAITARMEARIKAAKASLAKFKEKFEADPMAALSWSEEAFQAAASLKIRAYILTAWQQYSELQTLESLKRGCEQAALSTAKFQARTSSPQSDLMRQYTGAAQADEADFLDGYINHLRAYERRKEAARLVLTRTVFKADCPWLDRSLLKGETLYRASGPTYGCIGPNGIAASFEFGEESFFEIPADSFEQAAAR